tara:strand:- start:239 stop:910 length:672 start_codon:yes stop_codon:yes gene_type:complete
MKKINFIITSIILAQSTCLILCNWNSINDYLFFQNHIYEFLGVLCSIVYVILSIKQNIFCWPTLIIAAILNGYAFYLINLPLQSIMQLFFIFVAISGWISWKKKEADHFLVNAWNKKEIIFWISIGLIITLELNSILKTLKNSTFESEFPFFDSLMFVFNIMPMYMTTKKVIQSWLLFIVIDIISGFFYLYTGDYFYCFLFFFYIPFATYGYLNWKKHLNETN